MTHGPPKFWCQVLPFLFGGIACVRAARLLLAYSVLYSDSHYETAAARRGNPGNMPVEIHACFASLWRQEQLQEPRVRLGWRAFELEPVGDSLWTHDPAHGTAGDS